MVRRSTVETRSTVRCDPASGMLYASFGNAVHAAYAMHGAIAPLLERA